MKRRPFILGSMTLGATSLAAPGILRASERYDAMVTPSELPEDFLPREVRLKKEFEPYQILVDPGQFALYWTMPKRKAMRYTVGVGRTGLYESGVFYVGAKKKWPSWTPTPDMIERQPELYEKHEDGMPGGPNNPLGARALYLFEPGRGDTFLRIHGTNQPKTLGRRVSNGCARLVNDQIIEFYERVPMDTKVTLYPMKSA